VGIFITRCYRLGLVIPCNWETFEHHHPFVRQPHIIAGFDRVQCCMALTALVCGERLRPGTVVRAWACGALAALVTQLGSGV
jgi:hypothetical protein